MIQMSRLGIKGYVGVTHIDLKKNDTLKTPGVVTPTTPDAVGLKILKLNPNPKLYVKILKLGYFRI